MKIRVVKDNQTVATTDHERAKELLDGGLADSVHPDDASLFERARSLPPVTAWRFHAVLEARGLRTRLEAVLAGLPPADAVLLRARLDHSLAYDRFDPVVADLGAAMEMSETELDELWMSAGTL